jgi:sporulation protein YlmC with PRC-barrel domain
VADAAEFLIGVEVTCNDGAVCGEVERLILDPVARTATHLVVRAGNHPRMLDRLVPVALAETGAGGAVRLNCSADDFAKLGAAEEKHTVSESSFGYFHITAGGVAAPAMGRGEVTVDETVPFGEVDVHRGDRVRASDGEIGHVEGLVIERSDRRVTHVLLQEGHVWGRKRVAIPIDAVTRVADDLEVGLTKQQVHDLPSVDIDDREHL